MFRCLKNNHGSALVAVLLLMVVLSVLGVSILSTSLANTKTAVYQDNSMKAYYLAYSGANTLADYIMNTPGVNVNAMVSAGSTSPEEVGEGNFSLDVAKSGSELVITGIGEVNDVTNQAVVVLEQSVQELFSFTILAEGAITISNHVNVIGKVATKAPASSVSTDQHAFPQAEDIDTDVDIEIPEIEVPGTFSQVVSETVTDDYGISVSGEQYVHLEQGVALSNGKTFSVTGNGTLHLYVSNGWSSANHSQLVTEEDVQLFVYIIDNSNVYIRSDEFTGSIYAPDSSVTFNDSSGSASGGRNFHGSIIAKEVHLDGNHTFVEHDPDTDTEGVTIRKPYIIKEWR